MELTLNEIRPLVAALENFLSKSKPGDSKVFIEANMAVKMAAWYEDIYMTNFDGNSVIVHYAANGDWSKALLIPKENFPNGEEWGDEYSPADEAIGWFLK